MHLVKVDELKPGIKVAKPVSDPKGILLFKEGTVLTPELITRLKDRMVERVYVEEADTTGVSEEEIARRKMQVELELHKMFADVLENPLMSALYEAARNRAQSKVG